MKIEYSKENPFEFNRYGYAFEILKNNKSINHLDFGAGTGDILKIFKNHNLFKNGVGVDISSKIGGDKKISDVTLLQIPNIEEYAISNINKFDSITILDVLEHIYDQKHILNNLYKMLKPKGTLIVTVPGKHLFSFFDMGNLKFVLPSLHKIFINIFKGKSYYFEQYGNPNNPLFGDVEKLKMWHQHFSLKEITQLLLESGFKVIDYDGSGFFTRPISVIIYFLPSFLNKPLKKLNNLDCKIFNKANLYLYALRQ